MDDLARRMDAARDHVAVGWTDARAQRIARSIARTMDRRRRARVAGRALALVALVALVAPWAYRRAARPDAAAPAAPTLRLADGSVVAPIDRAAVVVVAEVSPRRVVVRVTRGAVRFDVTHDPARVFRVECGGVAVQVLGTGFTVARTAEGARVAVARGAVRVFWDAHTADLARGESGSFPRVVPGAGVAALEPPAPVAEAASASSPPAPGEGDVARGSARSPPDARRVTWRALAERGDLAGAYSALARSDGEPGDAVAALFELADLARWGHHADAATAPLARVVAAYASDPRAPLAAFTLGRVELGELGRPREAAAAFAQARALDPQGSLAEDALADEVEAWSRAGDAERARATAGEYALRYPRGRRAERVRRLGGLE